MRSAAGRMVGLASILISPSGSDRIECVPMDQAREYKYAIGERVISVGQYYKGRAGRVLSQQPGDGGPSYSVDFGAGELALLKEEDLRAAD